MLKSVDEVLQIKKMQLPTHSKNFKTVEWNDKLKDHEMFSRIKTRTNLSRKEFVEKIMKVIDEEKFITDGPYVIKFFKSEFYVTVFVKLEEKYINIKTVLAYDMRLRANDRVFTVQEAEEIFSLDLSEFYKDGFVNSYYGNLLIEESLDRSTLEVFSNYILNEG